MNTWTDDEMKLWFESLRTIRNDFRRSRGAKVGVILVQGARSGETPFHAAQEKYPLLFGRLDVDANCRAFYRGGPDAEENRLEPLAADAGRLMRDAPPQVIAQIGRETYEALPEHDAQAWASVVYALAWAEHRGTALTASPKKLWHSDGNRSTEIPLDDVPKWTQEKDMPPKVREALDANDPPRRWYSRLDDLAGASVAACDLLLRTMPQTTEPTKEPPTAEPEWSKPQSPKDWADLFNCSEKTFKRRVQSGEIQVKKLSSKSYMVDLRHIPKTRR
jgi:hypothetical protein